MDSLAILEEAALLLKSIGVVDLCHPTSDEWSTWFPKCDDAHPLREQDERFLYAVGEQEDWFYIKNAMLATLCVTTAALAAGLTMGLMSLDPLMLTIKMRAAATQKEREQATALLPVVQQHHLLLVTLLLLNAMANEALPLFLDNLVPSYLAIIFSVTLVLFFGEIIPSAIFTGPNQIQLASRLIPLVKLVMLLLLPISYPIAKMLDYLLHDEDEQGNMYNRGELAALVRIQYEERLAAKQRHRAERAQFQEDEGVPKAILDSSVRNVKREIEDVQRTNNSASTEGTPLVRSPSIHFDEVSMVQGALSMKTRVAIDVYTPLRKLYAIPFHTILNERTVVRIYSSGYSRIPCYDQNPDKPKDITAIRGILMTKQLIVVNASDRRPLSTLPLYAPFCVSPKKNLVDLINMFQSGRGLHMALVCARPDVGNAALERGDALPASAGLMGIVTLEDVLEMLLQEQILDETDKREREQLRLAKWAITRWKLFVDQKKANQKEDAVINYEPKMVSVVNDAIHRAATDETPLLGAK
jgi:metal transporter CNNM